MEMLWLIEDNKQKYSQEETLFSYRENKSRAGRRVS